MHNHQTRKDFLNLGAVAGFSFLLGSFEYIRAKSETATTKTTQDHPNVAIIKRYNHLGLL